MAPENPQMIGCGACLSCLLSGGKLSGVTPQLQQLLGNATVLTPEVRTKAQLRLDTGTSVSETAKELGIGYDTVRKAIADGRLAKKKDRAKR